MKFCTLAKGIHLIEAPTNIGIIELQENKVLLIDTGISSKVGKKILKLLEDKGFFPVAVINTHSHADHCGANAYFKRKIENFRVIAPEFENAMIPYPLLEPVGLYSGVYPIKDLRISFLMAEPSPVDITIKSEEPRFLFEDRKIEIISLPGHSFNHIGIKVGEILFCGDALFSEEVLNKHKILFYVNIREQKKTLQRLRKEKFQVLVPSHGRPLRKGEELIELNQKGLNKVEELLFELLKDWLGVEKLLKNICGKLNIKINNVQSYFLLKATIMAYLSYFYEEGLIECEISENQLLWKRA